MVRVGILGSAGYTGGELIRLLLNHEQAQIVFAHSESNAGKPVTEVHAGLYGETNLCFTDKTLWEEADVVFFCFGHGKSKAFLEEHNLPAGLKIIDLAQDFRLAAPDNDFVYGLPELGRDVISKAMHIANPGCFATCIQLGLLPLAKAGLLNGVISVNAITGSTGSGQKPVATTHFSWRCNNLSTYKVFNHQHVPEIVQSLTSLQKNYDADIEFIPYRGDFSRGIFATEVIHMSISQEDLDSLYSDFYKDAVFTHYVSSQLDLKQAVGTNKCLIHADSYGDKVVITSIIDNLLKGAVGQALQNMNLMFNLPEDMGLKLKSLAF